MSTCIASVGDTVVTDSPPPLSARQPTELAITDFYTAHRAQLGVVHLLISHVDEARLEILV